MHAPKHLRYSSSLWRRWTEAACDEGLAWLRTKCHPMTQWMSGTNVSGRVFTSKEGILSIQKHPYANVYKQVYVNSRFDDWSGQTLSGLTRSTALRWSILTRVTTTTQERSSSLCYREKTAAMSPREANYLPSATLSTRSLSLAAVSSQLPASFRK